MPVLEITKPGLLTTIQDAGRRGSHFYALPTSGAMDPNAAAIALLLLDQDPASPLIECTSLAPSICFYGPARIALTGADFHWTLNGHSVPLNTALEVQDGDVLNGKHARDQLRGYIAVAGDWQGDKVYGSHSTYLNGRFGGWQGRALQKGDRLEWRWETAVSKDGIPLIPIQKGPEYDLLSPAAQTQLVSTPYEIAPDSNRMGARLIGPVLDCSSYQLPDSVPVLPGFIQLPPSGQPIVVLQDGQVTGGYPRIAYVRVGDLGRLNRVVLGGRVWFVLDST